MSREIKFRAWDEINNKMYPITGISFVNKDVWLQINDKQIMGANFSEIQIMQYTGLKDKNDKEIYEGDILLYYHHAVGQLIRVVTYKYGAFGIEGSMNGSHIVFGNVLKNEREVIGNIYENPNLLKGLYVIKASDLDKRICDCENGQTNTQTYRDYIREAEEQFSIAPAPIDRMDDEELQSYLEHMDYLWEK